MYGNNRKTTLHWAQYGIRSYIWVQTFLLILWTFSSIVPGVGNVLNTETGFNSVSHTSFWLSIEILLLTIGGTVISLNSKDRVLKNALILYIVVLVLGIVANVIHIVASIMELVRCTSLLCMNSPWVLLTLTCIYGGLVFCECVACYLAARYRSLILIKN